MVFLRHLFNNYLVSFYVNYWDAFHQWLSTCYLSLLCINVLFNFQSLILYCTDLGFAFLHNMHGIPIYVFIFFPDGYNQCWGFSRLFKMFDISNSLPGGTPSVVFHGQHLQSYKFIQFLKFHIFPKWNSVLSISDYFNFDPHCL